MAEPPIEELQSFCASVVEKKILLKFSALECKSFLFLPLFSTHKNEIAVISPLNQEELDQVSKIIGKPLVLIKKAPKSTLIDLIDFLFAKFGIIKSEITPQTSSTSELNQICNTKEGNLLKQLIEYQVANHISDLIFVPQISGVEVIVKQPNGLVSRSTERIPLEIYEKMLNILKVFARLDFSSNLPWLEGAFRLKILGRDTAFRISIVSTLHGKSTTIRYLTKGRIYALKDLIWFESELDRILEFIKKPSKLKFIVGPMGSGKTTLLYSILTELAKNSFVISIEDPPEAELQNVAQIPVKRDFDYAQALRSVLRHNPDHIALGELRDSETLKTAMQASSIGHSIFATIHANDPISFETRLLSLGVPLSSLQANLEGLLFPKLLPRLCEDCKTVDLSASNVLDCQAYNAKGCEKCSFLGVSGKILITELYFWSGSFYLGGLSFKDQWQKLVKEGLVGINMVL